ncbi:adenosylcobinamide-GDP ribazoletransferase [Ornithinimicrobium cryptoxanthini]|uniref:Adenosylcobinamide-GDP ribazoletransferase n=1 Tax=Ornithinimicrobium cryptoxanthini TaxID=2934161 RepID=A0ABY4YKD7_9MICO|nr:adenosylcobinamide-GDP ribazoletransferase [Ornithinimicrobium cryptoxanthini]USQ77087.1 adenosylcobinamide-GDP ribazoletransferase [Ornithinimicrobium cryptoxanthini]
MRLRDGWRLAVGTLTRIPVRPPEVIDRASAGVAMLAAPVAALPLAVGVGLLVWAGQHGVVSPLAVGLLAVGLLAWGTRMLHLDGLSDTVDGLTASTDRVRSLEVMRSGTAGPSGVVALVVVIGLQAVCLTALVGHRLGPLVAAAVVVASRSALAIACARGVPAARPDGLGATVAGSVHPVAASLAWLVTAALVWAATLNAGPDLGGLLAPALAALAVAGFLWVAVRRVGGVTGDVLGACVEVALTVLLLSVA